MLFFKVNVTIDIKDFLYSNECFEDSNNFTFKIK